MLCVVSEEGIMNKENQSTATARKADHLALTNSAQTGVENLDQRFDYEPLFESHPVVDDWVKPITFLGKRLKAPLWISSMTGGTREAKTINTNLAKVAKEFGLGFGLGSCRSLLDSNDRFEDFNFRPLLGEETPFYANLGIAQVEQTLAAGEVAKIHSMVERLQVDGLIIHINPLQEWFQPEGDRLKKSPLETLQAFLTQAKYPVIVKEVGQGFGPRSLKALMQLPLAAIEFGAFGGTNFSQMERLRDVTNCNDGVHGLQFVGHTAAEMLTHVNQIIDTLGEATKCRSFIISGGIRSALSGYELITQCRAEAVYAQAKPFLDHARGDYETLQKFVLEQVLELEMARRFLTVRL
ncbi:MAG: type 2 isopentenyl-diphosphate Delta-isomerase [Halobacteriovorax sp.]|nr:type 2 isopentenyl-diphosphate Delta-isomerase [Halobacteriovorax sp.]